MAIINVETRDGAGKGVARKLRREGRIPAVLYGGGKTNINLSIDSKEWNVLVAKEQTALRTNRQEMVIDRSNRVLVLMRGFQIHPLSGNTVHVDFTRFDPTQRIELFVPVRIIGDEKCPGIKSGGILQVVRHELEIKCLAGDTPGFVEVSVENMEMGDSIHIDDIQLPDGVEVHREVNFTLVTIVAVKAEAVVAEDGEVVDEVVE